jgi:hypothetical protein
MTARTKTLIETKPVTLRRDTHAPFIAYASLFLLGLLTAAAMETLQDYVTQWSQRELVRVTSTDGRVDAVFAEQSHGPLREVGALYLVPKGDPASPSGALFHGTAFKQPPKLVWRKPQLLEMVYGTGCINGFANVWHSGVVEGGNYYVEVRLSPTRKFACINDQPKSATPVGEASSQAKEGKAN